TKVDLGLYRLTLKNDARTGILNETTATINVSRMRSNFGYEFDLTAAIGNANISSSNTHNFLLEPEAPAANRTLAVGPEGILSASEIDNVASVSVNGITVGKNDEVLEEISYDTTEKKLKLTKSMLFGAPNKSYVVEFKDATGVVIQKLNLVVENTVSKESATRSIQIDQRLLSTGWIDKAGRYVYANDDIWHRDNVNMITDVNIATGSSSGGTTTNVRYIYRLNNGIIERAETSNIDINGVVKYQTGDNPLYYVHTRDDFFYNFAVRKVTTGAAPVEYKLLLLTDDGEEIEAIVNLTGTTKGMTVGSGTLDTTTLLNNAITKINGGNPLLSNTAGSFVDAKGGLTSNVDDVIATHVSYKIGTGAEVTVPLTIGTPFMTNPGNYELSLNAMGEIEVKKLDISKAYNDEIEIKAQKDVSGTKVDLGVYKLTLKNDARIIIEIIGDSLLDFGNLVYQSGASNIGAEKIFKVKNPGNLPINFSVKKSSIEVPHIDNNLTNTLRVENIEVQKIDDFNFKLKGFAEVNKLTEKGQYRSKAGIGEIEIVVDIN
ncbi:MAG: hypothetical protein ACRDDH_16460, partial [Cetobacterium sp.]|uniref:hypothetical protein n=1 Tax=Cetobacterium sp. TaxID=2071632 RepID=UPI003EE60C58